MSLTPQQNIMMGKIEKMRSLLMKQLDKNKQYIVWSLKYDEIEMMDAFCLVENSDHAKMDDIIINFKTPFTGLNDYSTALIEELRVLQEQTKDLAGDSDWVLKNWEIDKVLTVNQNKSLPGTFYSVLLSMANAVPDFGGKIIAFLEPTQIADPTGILNWLRKSLENEIPLRIVIMLNELDSSSFFSELCDVAPKLSTIISPDLEMDQAIKQMATAGNPSNPDVQFRKYIFNMSEAVGKKNSSLISKWHDKAVEVSKKAGWNDMSVTAHLAAGTFMLNLKNTDEAINYYNSAIDKAEELVSEGHYLGAPLIIQAYAAKGAALIAKKKYEAACECYLKMANTATGPENILNALEAWRLAGYCYRNMGDKLNAWECNWNAVAAAEGLAPDVRPHTALPYVGKELLELIPRDKDAFETKVEINNKMTTLVGDGWELQHS